MESWISGLGLSYLLFFSCGSSSVEAQLAGCSRLRGTLMASFLLDRYQLIGMLIRILHPLWFWTVTFDLIKDWLHTLRLYLPLWE